MLKTNKTKTKPNKGKQKPNPFPVGHKDWDIFLIPLAAPKVHICISLPVLCVDMSTHIHHRSPVAVPVLAR